MRRSRALCYNDVMNLPNQLTLARCVLAGVFVALMSIPSLASLAAAYVVFTAAAITDHYDGKLARRYGMVSNFGKLMDPLADKVLMVAAFIMMRDLPELWVPGWAVVVILAREFLVTGARALVAADGVVLGANTYGKAKTVFQMVYVFVFLALAILWRAALAWHADAAALQSVAGPILQWVSMAAISIVALYTAFSGAQFAWANWQALRTAGGENSA